MKSKKVKFETWENLVDLCKKGQELKGFLEALKPSEVEILLEKTSTVCPKALDENPLDSNDDVNPEVAPIVDTLSTLLLAYVESTAFEKQLSTDELAPVLSKPLMRLLERLVEVWLHLPPDVTQSRIAKIFQTVFLTGAEGRSILCGTLILYFLLRALAADATQADVTRVYKLRDALTYLDFEDQQSSSALRGFLIRCYFSFHFLRSEDGRRFLGFVLGCVHPSIVEDVFESLKLNLPTQRSGLQMLKITSQILCAGWKSSSGGLKLLIEEKLQDLILAAILCEPKIASKCRECLHELHQKKDPSVVKLMSRLQQPLIYRYIPVANWKVRLNAVALFAVAFPFADTSMSTLDYEAEMERQYTTLYKILEDSHPDVRRTAVHCCCRILGTYLEMIPLDKAVYLMTTLFEKAARDKDSINVRAGAVEGICFILGNPMCHEALKQTLPSISPLLHDKSIVVRHSIAKLLHKVSTIKGLNYAKVAPLDDVLARLEKEFVLSSTEAAASSFKSSVKMSHKRQQKLQDWHSIQKTSQSVTWMLASLLSKSLYTSSDDLVVQFDRVMAMANTCPKALFAIISTTAAMELEKLDAVRLASALYNSAVRRLKQISAPSQRLTFETNSIDEKREKRQVISMTRLQLACVRELLRSAKIQNDTSLETDKGVETGTKHKGRSRATKVTNTNAEEEKVEKVEKVENRPKKSLMRFVLTSFPEDSMMDFIGTTDCPCIFRYDAMKMLLPLNVTKKDYPRVAGQLREELLMSSLRSGISCTTDNEIGKDSVIGNAIQFSPISVGGLDLWGVREAVIPLSVRWGILQQCVEDSSHLLTQLNEIFVTRFEGLEDQGSDQLAQECLYAKDDDENDIAVNKSKRRKVAKRKPMAKKQSKKSFEEKKDKKEETQNSADPQKLLPVVCSTTGLLKGWKQLEDSYRKTSTAVSVLSVAMERTESRAAILSEDTLRCCMSQSVKSFLHSLCEETKRQQFCIPHPTTKMPLLRFDELYHTAQFGTPKLDIGTIFTMLLKLSEAYCGRLSLVMRCAIHLININGKSPKSPKLVSESQHESGIDLRALIDDAFERLSTAKPLKDVEADKFTALLFNFTEFGTSDYQIGTSIDTSGHSAVDVFRAISFQTVVLLYEIYFASYCVSQVVSNRCLSSSKKAHQVDSVKLLSGSGSGIKSNLYMFVETTLRWVLATTLVTAPQEIRPQIFGQIYPRVWRALVVGLTALSRIAGKFELLDLLEATYSLLRLTTTAIPVDEVDKFIRAIIRRYRLSHTFFLQTQTFISSMHASQRKGHPSLKLLVEYLQKNQTGNSQDTPTKNVMSQNMMSQNASQSGEVMSQNTDVSISVQSCESLDPLSQLSLSQLSAGIENTADVCEPHVVKGSLIGHEAKRKHQIQINPLLHTVFEDV